MYLKNKMEEVLGITSDFIKDEEFIQEYESRFKDAIYKKGNPIQGDEAIDYLKRGAKLVLYLGPVTYYYVDTHPAEKVPYIFGNYQGKVSPLHPLSEIGSIKRNFDKNAFFILEEPIDENGRSSFLLTHEKEELEQFFTFLDKSCISRSIDLSLEQRNFEMAKELSSQINS